MLGAARPWRNLDGNREHIYRIMGLEAYHEKIAEVDATPEYIAGGEKFLNGGTACETG